MPSTYIGRILLMWVIWPCLIKKCGFYMLSCTLWNRFFILPSLLEMPLIKNFCLSLDTCRDTTKISLSRYSRGLYLRSDERVNVIVTLACCTPAWPSLYISSWIPFLKRSISLLLEPSRNCIASRMLDFPEPF